MLPRFPLYVLLMVAVAGACVAEDTPVDIGRQPIDVDFTWGVEIPMSDGTLLSGTLYRPSDWADDEGEPLSTIVTITPYISD